ncbi:winged helix-turn-helix transcriptional regulator [Dactylosporangium sucinum]|uniref:HxlR family transcriptional regulator n=1 Tax=Dactylosporangium sucinum TaxID=1424081 RepID=A0A917X7G5_9ACTN|nr:helix-turn-helix domain-containing protein [Dactylosporangium sucinum]GGM85350.1 HxlR family transcriptional regulator [Dactylosporangium sucinum]
MGASYYQFCPVAKAMELLDERWTLLVVRELIAGSQHFNDLRRGLPRMSPTLLSKRLQQLVGAGLVDRRPEGTEVRYELTPAGRELEPIVRAIGAWGVRWIGELGDRDLDPKLLLWDMRRNVDHAALPPGRTVIGFRFPSVAPSVRYWWLVLTPTEADVCDADPGHEVGVRVTADLRALVDVWLGNRTWTHVLRRGDVVVDGPADLRRALPGWFKEMGWVSVPRGTPSLVPAP